MQTPTVDANAWIENIYLASTHTGSRLVQFLDWVATKDLSAIPSISNTLLGRRVANKVLAAIPVATATHTLPTACRAPVRNGTADMVSAALSGGCAPSVLTKAGSAFQRRLCIRGATAQSGAALGTGAAECPF